LNAVTQMEKYYSQRPRRLPAASSESSIPAGTLLSEFDRYRQTLMNKDDIEGWASELRRYEKDRPVDVTKNTDIVQWWQVSSVFFFFSIIFHSISNLITRNMRSSTRLLRASPSISSLAKHPQSLANGCSLLVNKRLIIVELPLVRTDLKNYK
jgi:hypothetical protein